MSTGKNEHGISLFPEVERQPSIARQTMSAGAAAASTGFVVGLVSGLFRNVSPLLFGFAAAVQWGGLGAIYWSGRASLLEVWRSKKSMSTAENSQARLYASITAGGVSGMVMAAITRGRKNVLPAGLIFSIIAGAGQGIVNLQERTEGEENNMSSDPTASSGVLQWLVKQKWSPVGVLTNDQYTQILKGRILNLDVDIAMIDDRIRDIKQHEESLGEVTERRK